MMTLNDYRDRIRQAVDSQQLAMWLYRVLPLAYVELGLAKNIQDVQGLNVEVQLNRQVTSWDLWFNISGPHMLKVLDHLDPVIFTRMSGGSANASSITKGNYTAGFQSNTTVFEFEHTFVEQEKALRQKLSEQTSVESYWNVLMAAVPFYLSRTLGWEQPTPEQHEYLLRKVKPFQDEFTSFFKKSTMCDGRMNQGSTWARLDWANSSKTNFDAMIDSKHHPILQGCPFFTLRNGGVNGYYIQQVDFESTTSALIQRAKEETTAYCFVHDIKNIPIYALNDRLRNERVSMPDLSDMSFQGSL